MEAELVWYLELRLHSKWSSQHEILDGAAFAFL
jgi:hypothetical protein